MDIRFFRPYIRLLALASLSSALSLWAQKAAVEFPPTTNASQVGTSFVTGYQFSVKMPLSVNALGAVLDHSPSKAVFGVLPASMQVGLWDGSQKLLATATVYDTDPLSGNFNYSTITPVTLSPGQTYVVAGLVPAGKSTLSNVPKLATDPKVRYLGPRSAVSDNLVFPADDVIGQRNGYFAASFTFTAPMNHQGGSQPPGNADYAASLATLADRHSSAAGSDTVTAQSVAAKPVANAGTDLTVRVGSRVDLDGSGSIPAKGKMLHFAWDLTSMPFDASASLQASNTDSPWFVAPSPGTYSVQLVVNDGDDESAPALIIVNAVSGPLDDDIVVPQSLKIDNGRFTPIQIRLAQPAPPGGLSVSLVSSDTSKMTVSPATIFFPEGATISTGVRVSGVNAGAAAVTVSAAGLNASSVSVNVQ